MSKNAETTTKSNEESFEAAVFLKVSLRLLPLLFLMYVINLIDRTNIAVARLQMVDEQHMINEEAYSFGFGIFYLGYLVFEVPSNLILARIGARAWMARIMVSWGLISSAMMFATGPWSFAALRVLLGVAEAGFFPGIVYYMNDWFPARVRARAMAIFMTGGVIASIFGNSISGYILQYMDNIGGLWGWQWVFILEGLPSVGLGLFTLWYLTDRPQLAHWLTDTERSWLVRQIEEDRKQASHRRSHSLRAAFLDPRVWLLIAIYFTVAMGENSYSSYIPKFLKDRFPDWEKSDIGNLAAAPSLFALAGMILIGRHSDRSGERRWHVAGAAFTAAFGWSMMALVASGWLAIPGINSGWLFVVGAAVTTTGMKSMLPLFWTLPPVFLTGTAAAGGIALINSIANLGGLIGPSIIGYVKTETDSFSAGYAVMAATLLAGGLLALTVRCRDGRDRQTRKYE
jgi:ACS family tartrate transporter-like MFS transporter